MAKRRRRRPPQRPRPRPQASSTSAEPTDAAQAGDSVEGDTSGSPSRRAERKEEARRERERRLRQARRRQRTRRLVRWGILLGVALGIGAIVWFVGRQGRVDEAAANAAADRLSCTEVEEQDAEQANEHTEPFAVGQGGVPAFGGNHNPSPLPADPKVYDQPIPEENAVHNLEHGYVVVYYANDGDNALDPELISSLEDVVNQESEVLMAPYPDLEKPLYLMAWGARQSCDPPSDAATEDVVSVTEAFIGEWKNGSHSPEPAAT